MTEVNGENQHELLRPSHVGSRYQAFQRLAAEFGRAHNDNKYQFSVLMVEFDGLSMACHHRLAEAVAHDPLRTVSSLLTTDLGVEDVCYQLRDDEFLLILPARGESECRDLAERLGRRWNLGASAYETDIDVSIGFASSPAQGSTLEGLLVAADEAMRTTAGPETSLPERDARIAARTNGGRDHPVTSPSFRSHMGAVA